MNKLSGKIWMWLTALFAVVLVTYVFGGMVTAPWRMVPELGGDGGKNIYTYLYHIVYEHGLWFSGMNYPYGEHIVFTDGQPLLSVVLGKLGGVTLEQALTVLWWLIASSYVVAIVYTFKILTHFRVGPVFAMFMAGLIVVFSPQLLRITGHYALSYACFIPMLFYWTLKYHESAAIKYTVWMGTLACIATFLHPYYAAVSLVWVGLYGAGYLIFIKSSVRTKARHLVPLLIAAGSAFVLFGSFMKITDPVTDRPGTPFGVLENVAHIKDFLSSVYTPFWGYVHDHDWFSHISSNGEGYNYVGIAVISVVLFSFTLQLLSKKASAQGVATDATRFPRIWLFMAAGALLFSMGVPFIWHMEWLLNYASLLRQFRTLGRFSWIYYYIVTVYAVVVVSNWYTTLLTRGKAVKAYALVVTVVGLWVFEADGYVNHTRKIIAEGFGKYEVLTSKNDMSWPQFLAAHNYKKEDFQALLVLPYFETGSEKLWLCSNEFLSATGLTMGIKASLQLRLPMVDVMMSRSGWSKAFKQAKTAGGPLVDKPMLRELPSDKPFLLLNYDKDTLSPDQQYLLAACDTIGHYSGSYVYACYPGRIKANDKKYKDSVAALVSQLRVGDTCIGSRGSWYINHFDGDKAPQHFFGAGARGYQNIDSTLLETIALKPASDHQWYEFSCWFLLPASDYKSPSFLLVWLDKSGNELGRYETYTKESTDNSGMWFRNQYYFAMPAGCTAIRCWLKNIPADSYLAMDELMLRPADALIVSKMVAGEVMVNNHLFKANSISK